MLLLAQFSALLVAALGVEQPGLSYACGGRSARVEYRSAIGFQGNISVTGGAANCSVAGTGENVTTLIIESSDFERCNVTHDLAADEFEFEVVVHEHPSIITDSDSSFTIRCPKKVHNEPLYEIQFKQEVERGVFDVFVVAKSSALRPFTVANCVALYNSGQHYQLIDKNGCPTERDAMSPFSLAHDYKNAVSTITTEKMPKIASSFKLHCDIKSCTDLCQAECDASGADESIPLLHSADAIEEPVMQDDVSSWASASVFIRDDRNVPVATPTSLTLTTKPHAGSMLITSTAAETSSLPIDSTIAIYGFRITQREVIVFVLGSVFGVLVTCVFGSLILCCCRRQNSDKPRKEKSQVVHETMGDCWITATDEPRHAAADIPLKSMHLSTYEEYRAPTELSEPRRLSTFSTATSLPTRRAPPIPDKGYARPPHIPPPIPAYAQSSSAQSNASSDEREYAAAASYTTHSTILDHDSISPILNEQVSYH